MYSINVLLANVKKKQNPTYIIRLVSAFFLFFLCVTCFFTPGSLFYISKKSEKVLSGVKTCYLKAPTDSSHGIEALFRISGLSNIVLIQQVIEANKDIHAFLPSIFSI